MALRAAGDREPTVPKGLYVDDSALLIGDISLGERCSVWPFALLRADDDSIRVGDGTAVMDMAFLEAPEGKPVEVGSNCIVSHCARLHGCVVEDGVIIGIGATVLDGARVGGGSVVAAGSVVPPGHAIPPNTVVAGVPAKVVREAGHEDHERLVKELATIASKAARYAAGHGIR